MNEQAIVVDPAPPSPQLIRDESKIRYGETLSTILRKNGIDHSVSYAISQELKSVYNLRRLKPRQEYIVEFSQGAVHGQWFDFEYI